MNEISRNVKMLIINNVCDIKSVNNNLKWDVCEKLILKRLTFSAQHENIIVYEYELYNSTLCLKYINKNVLTKCKSELVEKKRQICFIQN
jgi:hypothetical protein